MRSRQSLRGAVAVGGPAGRRGSHIYYARVPCRGTGVVDHGDAGGLQVGVVRVRRVGIIVGDHANRHAATGGGDEGVPNRLAVLIPVRARRQDCIEVSAQLPIGGGTMASLPLDEVILASPGTAYAGPTKKFLASSNRTGVISSEAHLFSVSASSRAAPVIQ